MAHTFDTSAVAAASTANPRTLSFTAGATATVLVLTIEVNGSAARTGGAPTYNGIAMTQAGTTQLIAAGTNRSSTEIWYLIAPPTGSAFSISVPNTAANSLVLVAASFISATGVSQLGQVNGTISNSTNPTLSVTTATNGEAIISIASTNGGALTAGQTNISTGSNGANNWYSTQYALQANAGTINMSYTAVSGRWTENIVSFSEAQRSNNSLMMMGVGS